MKPKIKILTDPDDVARVTPMGVDTTTDTIVPAGWRTWTTSNATPDTRPDDIRVTVIVKHRGQPPKAYVISGGSLLEITATAEAIATAGGIPEENPGSSLVDSILAAAERYAESNVAGITTNWQAQKRARKALRAAVLSGVSLAARFLQANDGAKSATPAALEKAAAAAATRLGLETGKL